MPQPHVHPFYRIWFTTIDPAVCLLTALTCIFSPATILETAIPPSIEAYSPLSHGPLLHQTGALFYFLAVIYGVLLRMSDDPQVWRIVQSATLGLDLGILATLWNALRMQGRSGVGEWAGGDWGNIGFTCLVAVIRVGFLAGVGGGKREGKKVA